MKNKFSIEWPDRWFEALPFLGLAALLVSCFLMGGASRADVQSLVVLRPLAFFFCALGILTIRANHLRSFKAEFAILGAIILLVVLHLIPLPPEIWRALPGRDVITKVDEMAGLEAVWRPLAMVPSAGYNALYSLSVPLAALLLGSQLTPEQLRKLLPLVICIALISAIWGVLQLVSSGSGSLYSYRITNSGTPVGLFANRNHQAVLLAMLIPMVAVLASRKVKTELELRARSSAAIAIAILIVPIILSTGSRAGLLLALVCFAAVPFIYRKPELGIARRGRKPIRGFAILAAVVSLIFMTLVTVLASRADSIERLMTQDSQSELRLSMWGPIFNAGWNYFPFGSGVGSFVEVYQLSEPMDLLSPFYVNHAHNELLEIFLTTGVFGLAILFIALVAIFRASILAFRRPEASDTNRMSRMGAVALFVLMLASIVDYPVRTPFLAALSAIFVLWLVAPSKEVAKVDPTS